MNSIAVILPLLALLLHLAVSAPGEDKETLAAVPQPPGPVQDLDKDSTFWPIFIPWGIGGGFYGGYGGFGGYGGYGGGWGAPYGGGWGGPYGGGWGPAYGRRGYLRRPLGSLGSTDEEQILLQGLTQ